MDDLSVTSDVMGDNQGIAVEEFNTMLDMTADAMRLMTPDQRIAYLITLEHKFCIDCGAILPLMAVCACWLDKVRKVGAGR